MIMITPPSVRNLPYTLIGEEATANPLLIVGPRQLEKWLEDYVAATSQPLSYTVVGHNSLHQGNRNCPEVLKEVRLAFLLWLWLWWLLLLLLLFTAILS